MYDILHHRRHRFDALYTLLTGRGATSLPRNAQLPSDVGLSDPAGSDSAVAHHAHGIGASRNSMIREGST